MTAIPKITLTVSTAKRVSPLMGGKKVRFSPADRALLAALLHRLRPQALGRMARFRTYYRR